MNCSECTSQTCENKTPPIQPDLEWKLNIGKVFRLLALISLACALYIGTQINQIDWKGSVEAAYPRSTVTALDDTDSLFKINYRNEDYYVSIATTNSYGGPLTIAARVNLAGKVVSTDILQHKDTPAYIQRLYSKGLFRSFNSKPAEITPEVGRNWDAISGATISSMAIMKANTEASHNIARQFFAKTPQPLTEKIQLGLEHGLLALMLALSFINIWLGNSKLKTAYTLISIGVVGFMANQLISVANFSALFLGFIPSLSSNPAFWILLGTTLTVIVVLGRNIYCGHICPFYALQYLLTKIGNLNLPLPKFVLTYGRYLPKIGLWAALMVGFLTINPNAGAYEPFSLVFSLEGEGIQWFIMPIVLIGCFFIPEMFCRFFCPAGEMMSTILRVRNSVVQGIKSLLPNKKGDS